MHLAVIGTGYVGLVAGACFAEAGNDVICVDIDAMKIARLQHGEIPIYEPGLDTLVLRNAHAGRLHFTTDLAYAVRESDICFIAVGTPPGEDGSADLSHVLAVAAAIGDAMNGPKIVVDKSTVPVGTAAKVRAAIAARTTHPVHVVSNPEFLKEGAAIQDFMKPDRVVIGTDDPDTAATMRALYAPFMRTGHQVFVMNIASAELAKYAANAALALRISMMNLYGRLASATGADVEDVRRAIGSDARLGPSFLFPGVGYGGSCFPKDVKALIRTGEELGVDMALLRDVEQINHGQKQELVHAVIARFRNPASRRLAIWGLSFKPETDDMREAPSLVVIDGLLREHVTLQVHDPVALTEARRHFGDALTYCTDNYECLQDADALIILTEWQPYRSPDFDRIRALMRQPIIFDGRNLYDLEQMRALGFEYHAIGRPPVLPSRTGTLAPAAPAAPR